MAVGPRAFTGTPTRRTWSSSWATDEQRQTIPWVKVTNASGETREYAVAGASPDLAGGVRRRMECTDCHNRPSHAIAPTAQRAVDYAIARGDIPATLPFVRRESAKALEGPTLRRTRRSRPSPARLATSIGDQQGPSSVGRGPDLERAIGAVQNIYRRSVFPDMKVTFGTYPNHISHTDAPGCFRCHDDDHVTKDGKALGQDCETCHVIE